MGLVLLFADWMNEEWYLVLLRIKVILYSVAGVVMAAHKSFLLASLLV